MDLKRPLQYPLQSPRGSILVVSLWMIAILTILSVSTGQHVRQKIALADRIDRRNWLRGISETGAFQMLYKLRQKKEANEGYHSLNDTYTSGKREFSNIAVGEGGTYTIAYSYQDVPGGEFKIHYGVEDEEGKININEVGAKVLSQLFQRACGIEQELADEISYAIVDWRDTDDALSHPEYGAESDYYEDLETPHESKNGKFESIEELLLVRGITQELFEKIRPFITIYGTGTVNINTAPRGVLLGLGMNDALADKIMLFRMGADFEEGTPDDGVFSQPAGGIATSLIGQVKMEQSDINLLTQLIDEKRTATMGRLGINSRNFRIRSMGAVPRKQQVLEIDVVADVEGKILSWSTGVPRRMTPLELDQTVQKTQNM